ncbi:HDOD domain-containing protein [Hydrogenophaga sp.]|uniref:HDOD domain-containing protein n=1 Tax=Hydrogenophaga sp. TaxID=1904254 RepID=UPI003F6F4FE6
MSNLLLSMAALPLLALAWWGFRRSTLPATRPAPQPVLRAAASLAPAPAARKETPTPDALVRFQWRTEGEMEPDKRERLLAAIRDIPHPPQALQRILSPDFLARASSTELREVIMGEPLIAAKVLASINSPFYGLHTPVTDLGQAVTFLGIHSVHSTCLQHMLAGSFKPKLPGVQRTFDTLWKASAIASEIASRLDKALHLPAQGTLATQVVLSFVGLLATASVIPPTGLSAWLQRDRLGRARLEQDLLGLNSTEIGHLLLNQRWSLPSALVADVYGGGRLMVTAPQDIDPARVPRLALAHLCARLGERLAMGQLASLETYSPADDEALDMHHLRACLALPVLSRLNEALHAPELLRAVQQMQTPVTAD